jgi:hypothetical protein
MKFGGIDLHTNMIVVIDEADQMVFCWCLPNARARFTDRGSVGCEVQASAVLSCRKSSVAP